MYRLRIYRISEFLLLFIYCPSKKYYCCCIYFAPKFFITNDCKVLSSIMWNSFRLRVNYQTYMTKNLNFFKTSSIINICAVLNCCRNIGVMTDSEGTMDHRQLFDWSKVDNISETEDNLPIDMRFNDGHRLSITAYSILMVFSAIGNITVLVLILKRRRKSPSRINTMLMHLAIADLLVSSIKLFLTYTPTVITISCLLCFEKHLT